MSADIRELIDELVGVQKLWQRSGLVHGVEELLGRAAAALESTTAPVVVCAQNESNDMEAVAAQFVEGFDEAHRQGIAGSGSRAWAVAKIEEILEDHAVVFSARGDIAEALADALLSKADLDPHEHTKDGNLSKTHARAISESIRLGIETEEDSGVYGNIQPGFLSYAQIGWLGTWLAAQGFAPQQVATAQEDPTGRLADLPFIAVHFDAGTTFALTGENAGHWVEGRPTHVPIETTRDRAIDGYSVALSLESELGREPTDVEIRNAIDAQSRTSPTPLLPPQASGKNRSDAVADPSATLRSTGYEAL